ncbi:NAD-dependent epimerase/dehydratase family protein [Microbacterium sp.]|uniref:NAD-dependent epimerase/dehydratase family protein n=1 Tax=Microbacterium sp. TaxID=51671 RepID=UPI003FA57E77
MDRISEVVVSPARPAVAVTGASGFLGGAVVRERPDVRKRALFRTPPQEARRGTDVVVGDLLNPDSLARLLDGVHTLLHCASYVGPDSDLAVTVNDVGARALMRAAARAGVQRVVYLSTTGVYGQGPFVGAGEDTLVAPTSMISRTRAVAEEHVLAYGGTVIRPHLTYGIGDTRVIPTAVRTLEAMRMIPRPSPLVSAVPVQQLASQVWTIAAMPELAGRALNADHGAPISLLDLLSQAHSISYADEQPAHRVFDAALAVGASPHQAGMLTAHNYFSSGIQGIAREHTDESPIWAWYRTVLGRR